VRECRLIQPGKSRALVLLPWGAYVAPDGGLALLDGLAEIPWLTPRGYPIPPLSRLESA